MKKLHCLVALFLLLAVKNTFANTLVVFHTSLGDIEVELFDQDKPVTVKNFLRYAQGGFYNNTIFHRCPTDAFTGLTDFVLQGGEYTLAQTTNGLAYFQITNFPPIVDEFGVGKKYSNVYGTLAMAKVGGDTNSATSSWYFNLANNSFLDAADTNDLFTVFGEVVRGTNVLNDFIGRSYTNNSIVNFGGPFDSAPVTNYLTGNAPALTNFYFVTISVLSPQIKLLSNGTRQISWGSINGLTNTVEYSTNLPVWHTLTNVMGTGNPMTNLDTTTNVSRFYRMHILYQ